MPRFNYDDMVKVRADASADLRAGEHAWVVAVFDTRPGPYFDKFPDGVVYMVEFDDGSSLKIHEENLEPFVMNDFTVRQIAQMRFGISDFRKQKIALNTLLARLEGAARALRQDFWENAIFDIAVKLQQFNVEVTEEGRTLTSKESSQVEALLTQLEGRLNQVQ